MNPSSLRPHSIVSSIYFAIKDTAVNDGGGTRSDNKVVPQKMFGMDSLGLIPLLSFFSFPRTSKGFFYRAFFGVDGEFRSRMGVCGFVSMQFAK